MGLFKFITGRVFVWFFLSPGMCKCGILFFPSRESEYAENIKYLPKRYLKPVSCCKPIAKFPLP